MPTKVSRLADFLPYLLTVTQNAVSDLISYQYRAEFDLKVPEWRVMVVLGDAGSQTQRELVRATLMDKVAVNRACKVLGERGLVIRSPNDRDGRSHHLELSPTGRAIHTEMMPLALELDRRIFSALTPDEVDQFTALLVRIRASADAIAVEQIAG